MPKRRWIPKSLLALLSLLLILNVSSAGADRTGDYGGYEYPQSNDLVYKNPDWMAGIPDDRRLSELSIPGTHETMAWDPGIASVADCQIVWLENQLRSGVRALDIRLAREAGSDVLLVFHGWITQDADFNDVLHKVVQFLEENDRETVLMRISEADAGLKLDPGDFERRVKKYFEEREYEPYGLNYEQWRWQPTSDNPTLGEVRRQIVILDEFGTHVTGEWVDIGYEDADVGQFSSLALDGDDQPHISYYDDTQKALIYAYPEGSGKWGFDTVDSAGDVGLYTSLALDGDDQPHISYYDLTDRNLKYAYLTDSGWVFYAVDSTGDVGMSTSLALDGDHQPHISYYDSTKRVLKYARRTGGDSDWDILTVDSSGHQVGSHTSLVLDGGDQPHISYFDATDGDLKYAYKDDDGWVFYPVDIGPDIVGLYTSLALDGDDQPHISYYDFTWGNLKYAHRTGGDGDWDIKFVDHGSKNDVGQFSSLALHGDVVHISYYDANEGELQFAYKERNWDLWVYQTVDNWGDVGRFSSLALDTAGNPHISYYEATNTTNGDLKYAGPSHVCIEGDSRITFFGLKYEERSPCQFIQDDYKLDNVWDLVDRKWPQVEAHLQKADEGAGDSFYMNYLSASEGAHPFFYASGHNSKETDSSHRYTGVDCSILDGECDDWYPWPYGNCDENGICAVYYTGTNELTTLYLSNHPPQGRPRRWGIIWADFPGGALIDAIIQANFPQPLLYLPAILK